MAESFERLAAALADRYRIVRELGVGGMATVYLADDLKHHREVALKVLRRDLAAVLGSERFLREIRVTANFNHPHILPLHDSGVAENLPFYVMPLVKGESLRQKLDRETQLSIEETCKIAEQVAGALDYAHRQGVIHRDIKPENILLHEGEAVVADFGIARALRAAAGERLTETGLSLGTPHYMSPEQASGDQNIDARSDIYSLASVTYEMLAGEPPHTGGTVRAIISKVMTEIPRPLRELRETVPAHLDASIQKALAKVPADRFSTAAEFADALTDTSWAPVASGDSQAERKHVATAFKWVGRFAVPLTLGLIAVAALLVWGLKPDESEPDHRPRTGAGVEAKMIVVLPLENLGAPEDEYFAEGMTDEITSRLGAVSGLGVISRRRALRYAGSDKSNREVGEELGVEYILSGRVHWAGDGSESRRVRINPELIRVADNAQLWSGSYLRVIDDIFEVQSEIAGEVIERLGVTLLESERRTLAARPTENPEAYRLYLKGRYFWNKRTEQDIQTGLDYFQEAVDLDPSYALAHVGIADTWIFRGWYSVLAPKETFPKAKQAVINALQFDETLAEAHTSRAHIYLEFDHDWEAAEREYTRAIQLNESYPIAHHWYGGYLSAMGRHEEALREAERARELDPLSPIINTWVGLRHYFARRYEQAIEEYEKALELYPRFAPAHWHFGWALEQMGRYTEAISEAQQAIDISDGNPLYIASLGHAYAMAGNRTQAMEVLDQLERESATRHVSAYHTAVIYVALGEKDHAFRLLDGAFEERSPWIGYMAVDPRLDELHGDPRLTTLLRRAKLTS